MKCYTLVPVGDVVPFWVTPKSESVEGKIAYFMVLKLFLFLSSNRNLRRFHTQVSLHH